MVSGGSGRGGSQDLGFITCSLCGEQKDERTAFVWYKGKRMGRQCRPCRARRAKQRAKADPARRTRWNERKRRANQKLKAECMAAYGGKCACCKVTDLEFLTIEHTWRDGFGHREQVGRPTSGSYFYRWLRDQKYPRNLGLTVLCFNCNFAVYWFETCPHQRQS